MTFTIDDFTMLSGNFVCVPLPDSKTQHVYLFAPYVHVPYVTVDLRTQYKVEQIVLPQSTAQHYACYVVHATNALDGLITTHIAIGIVKTTQPKYGKVWFRDRCFVASFSVVNNLVTNLSSELPSSRNISTKGVVCE
jgi:hypothetical protein